MNTWQQLSLTKSWCYYTLSVLSSVEPSSYMDLVLKYILVLFITYSRECHVNRPCFLSCSWRCKEKRDWGHKQRRLLWISMTISRKWTDVNGLKDVLNKLLMPQEFYVPASRSYEKRNLTLVELFFLLQQFFHIATVIWDTLSL